MFVRARLFALRSLLYVASDQKEKKKRFHDINLSQVSPLKGILIYEIFFFCVDSSERKETLCTLNSLNLTMKLMPPNHQNHPAMSLRYMLMLKYQTPYSQRTEILKRLVSEWNKYTQFIRREVRIGENCAQVLGHCKKPYARSSEKCWRKIYIKPGHLWQRSVT